MSEFRQVTRNDTDTLGFAFSPSPMDHRHMFNEHSITMSGHRRDARPHHTSEILFHPYATPSTPTCLDQPMEHNLTLRWPNDVEEIPSSFLPWPTAMDQTRREDILSGSYSVHDFGRHGTYLGSRATLDAHQTLCLDVPAGRPPFPLSGNPSYYPHDEPRADQSFSPVSHTVHYRYAGASNSHTAMEPSVRSNFPSQRLPHLPSSLSFPHPCPIPDQHVQIVQAVYTPSLSRNRSARAIEYDGLWLDEEELRKALMEPDGKLTALQCVWEHHHTPCYLWIKGDKSSINTHIQRWHGGKPGGEKLEVDCRWSSCAKKMRKESITRHILSVHLGQLWECRGCGKEITRNDAHRRHAATSESEACRTLDALITYSANIRVIDVRAALTSGGRLRDAGA